MPTLTLADCADLCGVDESSFSDEVRDRFAACDWEYEAVSDQRLDEIVIHLLERVRDGKFNRVENEDKSRWVKGWGENLQDFNASADIAALTPKYLRPDMPVRLFGRFVSTRAANFEQNWFEIFSSWFFSTYLAPFDHIFEFGSGSGINLANLAKRFPDKQIIGLDWAEPAVAIAEGLRTKCGLKVRGVQFDFFHPDHGLEIPPNSAILTVGAIEQTGTNFSPFLDFIMAKKPAGCFHIEPMVEWYDKDKVVDYTAVRAHDFRNFLRGYSGAIDKLEQDGKARVIKRKRAFLGSIAMEGYSQLLWAPIA